jgi:hypothetical protein
MAIGSFGRALGQIAKESVTGSVKGFASGVKGAFLSEMPGVTSAYGFAKDVRGRMADQGTNVVAKEQRTGNLISLEMVRELKKINLNVFRQTMFSSQQAKAERLKGMFAEEVEREKNLRDNALLNAIKDIGKNFKFGGKPSTTEGGGGGLGGRLLTSIIGGTIGSLLGKGIASVLAALAIGIKSILAAMAALAAKIGLQSLGGFGRGGGGTSIPNRPGRSAKTQPRIPKGQPGAGRFTRPAATGLRAGIGLAGTALRTNPFTMLLGAGLLLPEVLEMMGYDPYGAMADFFFPSAQGATNQKSSTSSTNDYLKKVIQVESDGRSNAQASTSSAYGLGQFVKETFESLATNSPKDSILYGKSFEDYKKSEELQIAALKALTEENRTRLVRSGLPTDDASLYLAHFLGAGVAHKVLQSNNNVNLKSVIPPSYFTANPAVFGNLKTVGDLKAWAARKMAGPGGKSAAGSSGGGGRRPPVGSQSAATDPGEIPGITTKSLSSYLQPAGGGTAVPTLTIPKVHDPIAEKKAIEANKFLKSISKSSGVTAKETKIVGNHYRPTRRIKTPQEKAQDHFEKTQENLLNTIDRTLTKFFGATLTDALIPGGYGRGVTASQASATGFIGNTIGRATGIDKKVSSSLTKIFGKEYGQMLAPAVSSLGKAYVNKLGVELGTSLFAGTMGSNEAASAITGQIVGNFAKGNKQMAMEQMLYAFTGMPTGPETIAAHYGFSSAAQGIQHIAEYGAATITNQVQGMTGMAGRPQSLPNMPMSAAQGNYSGINPRGRNILTGGVGTGVGTGAGYSATSVLPGYGTRSTLDEGSAGEAEARAYMKNIQAKVKPEDVAKANESVIDTSETIHQLYENTDEWGSIHEDVMIDTSRNDIQTQQAVGAETVGAIDRLGSKLSRSGGGGTTIGIGGGGFGSSFGNFLMDMGTSLAVNKLVSGIKNPYLREAARFAGMYGMNNYVTPAIASKIGLPAGASAGGVMGASTTLQAGGIGSNIMSGFNTFQTMGPAYMMSNTLSNFAPSMYSIGSAVGGSALGSTFSQFGSGFTYGATPMGQAVGDALGNTFAFQAGSFAAKALPYAASIMQALKGDIKGAAITAAFTYVGTLIGGPIGGAIGSFIGGLFGKKKRTPKPTLGRAINVWGNNDITQKYTVGVRDIKEENQQAFISLLDAYLNIAFNATKTIQAKTKMIPPFVTIVMEYNAGAKTLQMFLFQEGEPVKIIPANPKVRFNYGDPADKKFKSGTAAKQIVKDIEAQFTKQTTSQSDLANIQLATKEVTSQSFMELSSGLSSRLDLAKDAPISEQEKRYADAMKQISDKPMVQESGYHDYSSGDYSEGPKKFYNPVTGKYETVADPDNTLYIDSRGNPVIDVGQRGFMTEDLIAHEQKYGAPITLNLNNVDQSQNDSSTNLSSTVGAGSADPDSMAAASSGAYGPGINSN